MGVRRRLRLDRCANPLNLKPALVGIELKCRRTRGTTLCKFRVPVKAQTNAQVAMRADGIAVMSWVMDTLRGYTARARG